MAITDHYVDPSINANSGTGTIGDPYGDLQYALNSISRNTIDGDRINIKAGTAEVLTGQLLLSLFGTPSIGAGLILQGYTSTQGDGGIAEINGNGNNISQLNYISYIDLKMHNGSGSGDLIKLQGSVAINCEIYDAYTGIEAGVYSSIVNCYIHNCDQYAMELTGGSIARNCYIRSRSTDSRGAMHTGINLVGRPTYAEGCIISCDSATDGINCTQDGTSVINCSIISDGGTGQGIVFNSAAVGSGCHNNLIEGFSGAGGAGIHWVDSTPSEAKGLVAYNTIFDCTTTLSGDNDVVMYKANNTVPSASPFKKSGADTFANRFTYFEPDTSNAGTNLNGNGSQGAVAAAGGGGTTKHPLGRF